MSERELTPEAQIALHNYLRSRLIGLGSVLTALATLGSGILYFTIKEIGTASAHNAVREQAGEYRIIMETLAGRLRRTDMDMRSQNIELVKAAEMAKAQTRALQEETVRVAHRVQEMNTRIEEAQGFIDLTAQVANNWEYLADKLTRNDDFLLRTYENISLTKFAEMETKFSDLVQETRIQFAETSDNLLTNLAKLKGDSDAFQLNLRADLTITDAELDAMTGMTPEQILALLLAAGGAAMVGMVGARTGKSRAHNEIKFLMKKMEELLSTAPAQINRSD